MDFIILQVAQVFRQETIHYINFYGFYTHASYTSIHIRNYTLYTDKLANLGYSLCTLGYWYDIYDDF